MNSDVLDFLEEIDNTVNVFAVRAALKIERCRSL